MDTLGWCWIQPLEYGNALSYQQRPRTATSIAWLFSETLCGFSPSASDVRSLSIDVPGKLEEAVFMATELAGNGTGTEATRGSPERDGYREDSPFGQSTNRSTGSVERSFHWLHERGYTFEELYRLLPGEIDRLADGFEEAQAEKDQQQGTNSSGTTPTGHGNRADAAAQLGWR